MRPRVQVYANGDEALIVWTADELDPDLRGFALQRNRKRSEDGDVATSWLDNYAPPGLQAHQKGLHQPSDAWPFRTFSWTDHSAGRDNHVQYRVVPVLQGADAPSEEEASDWSAWRTIGHPAGAANRGYFNRGFVISQFMSRYLDEHYPDAATRVDALKSFKDDIGAHVEERIRLFLGGELRTRMLELLDEVAHGTDELHAALFELADEELLPRLVALGPRAHVVLANGSVKTHGEDENTHARDLLRAAHVDVEERNRFVAPSALAHNKFLVLSDAGGTPRRVWTGSTNWTTTGLCTQLNNGLLVADDAVAAAYMAQWQALRDAGSSHPPALATANSTPVTSGGAAPGTIRTSVQFTRARNRVDLAALSEIVNGAQEGILFLMFIPGLAGPLKDIQQLRTTKSELVIRGVVSELPHGPADEHTGDTTTVHVQLVGTADGTAATTVDVVQPEGKAHPAAWWAAETTHQQFKEGIGWAIIHSKVLVVDPFSDDPTIVTGSHNFSISASEDNDENYIVVRGDRALAEAYAVNVESAWRHYASRIATPHAELTGLAYLNALLDDTRAGEQFWGLTA